MTKPDTDRDDDLARQARLANSKRRPADYEPPMTSYEPPITGMEAAYLGFVVLLFVAIIVGLVVLVRTLMGIG